MTRGHSREFDPPPLPVPFAVLSLLPKRAAIERGAPFFFSEVSQFWELKTSPPKKLVWRKIKLLYTGRKIPRPLSIYDENQVGGNVVFPTNFELRSPIIQIFFQTKIAASVVAFISRAILMGCNTRICSGNGRLRSA